jgi:hypothetical protein
MYWQDGSFKLPFIPHSSYFISSSRALVLAGSIIIIEDQVQIVKSCVKIVDFDCWCDAASELVDFMIDFSWRDEEYLHQDTLSSCEGVLSNFQHLRWCNLVWVLKHRNFHTL